MTEGYLVQDRAAIFYWFLEYFRKICLVFVSVLTQTHLWLQMMVLFMLSVAIIIATGYIKVRDS